MSLKAEYIAVVSADTHLDHLVQRSRPEIRGDSWHGFTQLVDLTIKYKVDDLLLCGDIFECLPADSPNSETLLHVRKQLERLEDIRATCSYVLGQHDEYPSHLTALSDAAINRDGQVYHLRDKAIGFMSYRRTPQLASALTTVSDDIDMLVCHQEWKHVLALAGGPALADIVPLKGPSLIVSGDLHERKRVIIPHGDGQRVVVSPGATHARKQNEPSEHWATLLRADLTYDRVRLTSRIRITFVVEDETSFEQLYTELPSVLTEAYDLAQQMQLPPELHTPIIKISDASSLDKVESRLRQAIGSDGHLFYSRELKSLSKLNRGPMSTTYTPSFDVDLVEMAKRAASGNPEVASLLAMGLADKSPRNAVQRWRESYMNSSKASPE